MKPLIAARGRLAFGDARLSGTPGVTAYFANSPRFSGCSDSSCSATVKYSPRIKHEQVVVGELAARFCASELNAVAIHEAQQAHRVITVGLAGS